MSLLSFGDRFPTLTVARVNGPALELPDALAGRPGLVLVVPADALGPRTCLEVGAYLSRLREAEDNLVTRGVRVVVLSAGRSDAEAVAKWLGPRLTVAYLPNQQCLTGRLGGLHPDPPERSPYGDYAGFLLAPDGAVQLSVYTNDPRRGLCPAHAIDLLSGAPESDFALAATGQGHQPGGPTGVRPYHRTTRGKPS